MTSWKACTANNNFPLAVFKLNSRFESMVLKIFRSSAGSGKTHKLIEEYLKLVFANPLKYQRILAITFTNKATEEMKGRILSELFRLSKGDDTAHKHSLKKKFPKLSDVEIRGRAKLILQFILYDYSHFSISTIDSFFQKIVKGFSREIGIQYGYNVELDIQIILDRAVDQMMLKIGENKQLNDWLEDYAANRLEQGAGWDLKSSIKKFANEISKEKFQQNEKDVRHKLADKSFLSDFIKQLNTLVYGFESSMSSIGEKAILAIQSAGLSVHDFSYKESGVAGYFLKLKSKQEYFPTKRANEALDDTSKWYSKSQDKNIAVSIERLVESELKDLLQKAFNTIDKDYISYVSACEVKRYLFILGILTDISGQLSVIREDENIMLISDVNLLLRKVIDDNDTPFLYEKMGSRYQHFLIDEFQDTSQFQWHNIKPLLKNSLDSNYINLLVGDIKQSIYRWRGGDWSMLLGGVQKEIGNELIETISLNKNWRSRKHIVHFNNAVFSSCPGIVQTEIEKQFREQDLDLDDSLIECSHQIKDAFYDVKQLIPKSAGHKDGFVDLRFCKEDMENGRGWKEEVHKQLEIALDQLLKTYRQKDITFLVRRKKEGSELAEFLMSRGKYDVISKEALDINSSPAVKLLLAALHFINEEEDFINAVNLILAYQNRSGDEVIFSDLIQLDTKQIKDHLPDLLFSQKLKELSLYELVEQLTSLFKLQESKHEWAYLQAFNDLLLEYIQGQKADLASFLDWWEEFGIEKSIQVPDDLDALEIMTIHKAKGLDFKVVVIPYLDWPMDHKGNHDNILWTSSDISPFKLLEIIPVRYSRELINSLYVKEYYEEKVAAGIDSLNILYVALTRAVDGMLIFSKFPGTEKLNSVSDLLYHVLGKDGKPATRNDIKLRDNWDDETASFILGKPFERDQVEEKGNTYELDNYIINTDYLNIKVKHENEDVFDPEKVSPAKLNYGKWMHEILSKIIRIEDIEKVLNEMLITGKLDRMEKELLQNKLSIALNESKVKEWFSGRYKVLTENPILIPQKEYRIPDRVMIEGNKALVVDYKFGEESPSHKLQLGEYKNYLSDMNFKDVEGYLWYVDEQKIIEV